MVAYETNDEPERGILARPVVAATRTFTNTGPAASHARSARHVVSVDYRTTFRYLPQEVTPTG